MLRYIYKFLIATLCISSMVSYIQAKNTETSQKRYIHIIRPASDKNKTEHRTVDLGKGIKAGKIHPNTIISGAFKTREQTIILDITQEPSQTRFIKVRRHKKYEIRKIKVKRP